MLFFHSISKLVYHFTMVTLQKHHYTNNPTTKYTFIIAHVAILMAWEGIVYVNSSKKVWKSGFDQ